MVAADDMSLTSGKSLAGFHGARSILYLVIWRLFSRSYSHEESNDLPALIEAGAGALGKPRAWLTLREFLSDSGNECERARMFIEHTPCDRELTVEEQNIFATVGLDGVTSPADEARALGLLAQEAATALTSGNLPKAAEIDEMQVRLLEGDAASCLRNTCTQLEGSDDPFLRQLGMALTWLIDNDLSLLNSRAIGTAR